MVAKSPKFVARLFLNDNGKEKSQVPGNAMLLPGREMHNDENDCRYSSQTSARNLEGGSSSTEVAIMVDFPGASDYYIPEYTGDKLQYFSDSSFNSAWVYLFEDAMLHYAQEDYQSDNGPHWKNVKSTGENVQGFDSDVVPQKCKNLDRMLFLTTNMEASQKAIESFEDDKELLAVLDSMFKSPVLVVPKADKNNILASDRIWIGMKAASEEGMWSFYNPVERKYKTASLSQLKDSIVQDIVFINDHSSLPEDVPV